MVQVEEIGGAGTFSCCIILSACYACCVHVEQSGAQKWLQAVQVGSWAGGFMLWLYLAIHLRRTGRREWLGTVQVTGRVGSSLIVLLALHVGERAWVQEWPQRVQVGDWAGRDILWLSLYLVASQLRQTCRGNAWLGTGRYHLSPSPWAALLCTTFCGPSCSSPSFPPLPSALCTLHALCCIALIALSCVHRRLEC
jgi:hypothetical protein